jgi:hypothetical protein
MPVYAYWWLARFGLQSAGADEVMGLHPQLSRVSVAVD